MGDRVLMQCHSSRRGVRTGLLLPAALLALAAQAHATGAWTPPQQALGTAYVAAAALDWQQTQQMARVCPTRHVHLCWEVNPLLGRHPILGRVDGYFVLSTGAVLLAADLLPSSQRSTLLKVAVSMEVAVVARNYRLGWRGSF